MMCPAQSALDWRKNGQNEKAADESCHKGYGQGKSCAGTGTDLSGFCYGGREYLIQWRPCREFSDIPLTV